MNSSRPYMLKNGSMYRIGKGDFASLDWKKVIHIIKWELDPDRKTLYLSHFTQGHDRVTTLPDLCAVCNLIKTVYSGDMFSDKNEHAWLCLQHFCLKDWKEPCTTCVGSFLALCNSNFHGSRLHRKIYDCIGVRFYRYRLSSGHQRNLCTSETETIAMTLLPQQNGNCSQKSHLRRTTVNIPWTRLGEETELYDFTQLKRFIL